MSEQLALRVAPEHAARFPLAPTSAPAQLISLQEAADRLGVCYRTARRYVSDGRLTGFRVGPRQVKVSAEDLDALVEPVGQGGGSHG
ncbi:helix-turn-helix domain-containing protein [Mycobacterium marinum]|uniref:helix-turn-helix domain-containing protein n=1 Tax=Mycobacterium marinum TaxID=1781 RepID=UPI000B95D3B4|nr:helix-turn-helix domain-containing protein [Mycobacterium marinum]